MHLNPALMFWHILQGPFMYMLSSLGGLCAGFALGRWHAKWGGAL